MIPVRIELVSFQQPMVATDFDRTAQPPLAFTTLSPRLGPRIVGKYVPIDVTDLMVQAQRRGLADFQVRIMEDLGPPIDGLFAIDDSTGSNRPKSAGAIAHRELFLTAVTWHRVTNRRHSLPTLGHDPPTGVPSPTQLGLDSSA